MSWHLTVGKHVITPAFLSLLCPAFVYLSANENLNKHSNYCIMEVLSLLPAGQTVSAKGSPSSERGIKTLKVPILYHISYQARLFNSLFKCLPFHSLLRGQFTFQHKAAISSFWGAGLLQENNSE